MAKYIVDCSWQMYGHVEVEAEDVDEAIHIVEQQTRLSDITSDYVAGSFKVDHDTTYDNAGELKGPADVDVGSLIERYGIKDESR